MKRMMLMGLLLVLGTAVHARVDGYLSAVGGDTRLHASAVQVESPFVMAQARGGAARVSGSGQTVMVGTEITFGKDFTALWRPSRWGRPLAPGGVISWLNPRAWRAAPYRTLTVLAGELIFIGGSAAVAEVVDRNFGSSGGGRGAAEPEAAAPAPSTRPSAPRPPPASDPAPAPAPGPAPEPPPSGGGGFEAPF